MTSLKDLRFGTEIEFTGIRRATAAAAVAAALPGSTVRYVGGGYDTTEVVLADGRKYTIVSDGSVDGSHSGLGGELVTPILTWSDMEPLQAVVRALRAAGARANASCGQHVHVDGAAFKAAPSKLVNLVNLHVRREDMVRTALAIAPSRTARWCKPFDMALTERLRNANPTLRGLNAAWFGDYISDVAGRLGKYHHSRYHALNLYSFFYRGTVEFRHFNGTLHAGEIKANICLALGMVARALNVRHVSTEVVTAQATKAEMTAFCKRLGMLGDEFRNVRVHLSKAFPGRAPEAFLDDATPVAMAPTLAETIAAERRQMDAAGGTAPAAFCAEAVA